MDKKKSISYQDNVTFLPVTSENLKSNDNDNFKHYNLTKGKYDIDYVINLLRIIESQCRSVWFEHEHFSRSMCYSLNKLINSLLAEREQLRNPKPRTFRCDKCREIYFTLPDQPNAPCPHCQKKNENNDKKNENEFYNDLFNEID